MNGSNDPLKILLVEDNQGDARIIEELLKEDVNNQFLISHASRLETALKYLPEDNFDLILLDLHLEDSDGIGIPNNVDPENTDTLGLKLVNLLTEQLNGEIELKKDNGTNFTIKNLVCCPVDEF